MDLIDFFALDIGTSSLKIAQVKARGDKFEVLKLIKADNKVDFLNDNSEESVLEVATNLKRLLEEAKITNKNCVAAISEDPVFSRLISIPKVDPDKIEDSVHWELKSLIPVDLDEVNIAFLEIGERESPTGVMIDVYVAAAPKTFTNKILKVCELAGINLLALETESLSNTRLVSTLNTEKDLVVLDIGGRSSDITISREGTPIFTQTLSTSSDAFTKAIAADYAIDLIKAEKYKLAYGLSFTEGEGKIAKSIEPIVQIILNEFSRTLTYVQQRVIDLQVSKIVITGGGGGLKELPQYLSKNTNLPVELVNIASRFDLDQSIPDSIKQNLAEFSVALGLAIKDY